MILKFFLIHESCTYCAITYTRVHIPILWARNETGSGRKRNLAILGWWLHLVDSKEPDVFRRGPEGSDP